MKQMILIALMTMTGLMAQAAGRQEASAICTSMSFDSNRNQCISDLARYDYFEQGAIDICRGLSFDSGKNECVKVIGNKSYEAYEIDNCKKSSFDSTKTDCLKNSGRVATPVPPPPPPGYGSCSTAQTILQLQNIDRSVYMGRNNDARIQINELISRLQRCP
jgi:hypothetical protein